MQAVQGVFQKNQISLAPMNSSEVRHANAVDADALGIRHESRGLLTISAVVLASGALLLALISSSVAQPLLLTILAVLAVFGAFSMLAYLAGHIQLTDHTPKDLIAADLADQHPDAMMVTTLAGKPRWSNERMTKLLGKSSGGLLGSLEIALGSAPSVTEAMFRLSRAIEHGSARSEEINVKLSSNALGDRRGVTHVRVTVAPFVHQPNSEISHRSESAPLVLWTVKNISADRARELNSTKNFKQIIDQYDTMPIGVMTATSQGTITRMNETMCNWLGFEDCANLRDRSLNLKDVLASDGVELLDSMTTPQDGVPVGIDLDLVKNDGVFLPVRIMCQRIANASQPNGSVDSSLIITAINRSADQLDEAIDTTGTRFARFFRSAPFGIATVGKDGRIANTNASFSRMIIDGTKCLGQTAVSVLSKSAEQDAKEQIEKGLEAVLSGRGKVAPIDITAGKKGEFTRRIYMSPLTLNNKAPEAAILYVIDVTEQKTLEAKYAQSQKMDAVGKLAGFVAHDFNNMLTAIIGFSDFLLKTHRPTDAAYSDIINIKSSANRAAGLVGKLLALARQQTLLVEPLQLGEVMSDLAPLLKRSIGERIELKVSTGRDLWHVKTDKLQLEQAIINLAVNARDAMPEGGRLKIRTRNITEREAQRLQRSEIPAGEYVLLEVSDTGTGIDPGTLEKVFEPFFTTKEAGKGTGLGLATVYGIVKQSGGFILPQSTVGKGTTFKIYLPRYHLEEKDFAAIKEKDDAKKTFSDADLTGSGRVLLVEDEDVVRSFAVRALERQGYEVLEAEDGIAALEILDKSGPVDIVVSDVVMPGMDGPTMLKELRKKDPNIKIIFVSGYPNEAFQKALGEESFAFLPKPFSLPQLAAKVKEELTT